MSEPRLISPMLDEFEMGGPISNHDGVKCCPAMRKNSDDKYIVKIISVPASQTKLDALLLTGAYPDKNAALVYFKELANGVVDEKKILDKLSQLEGFVSYDDCQIVPMNDGTGYDVYLLGQYRMTLERETSRKPLTQLDAVNLGLDLCAGMAVCRRSGYMCVDLKPSNIFIVGDKEYRIGDLGFVRLNSLKYESLPDKYRSRYTAPELEDAFASLNATIDIYSVGLILYQVFNGGVLPFSGECAPAEAFPAPAYADAEMAEIILKACAPNPAERWQDPVQMGQAIVSYMQKNGVNDTPLCADSFREKTEPFDEDTEQVQVESPVHEQEELIEEIPEAVEIVEYTPDISKDDEELLEITAAVDTEISAEMEEIAENIVDETQVESGAAEDIEQDIESEISAEDVLDQELPEEEYDNLSFLDDLDETDLTLDESYEGVADDVSEMLNQIDELASHEVPAPVIAPEAVEIKLPDPIPADMPNEDLPEENADDEGVTDADEPTGDADASDEETALEDSDDSPEDETVDTEIPEEELPYIPKKKRNGLIWCIVIVIILALAVGGYFFYTEYYLQPIHTLELTGSEDKLQIQLTAEIDESQLTVVCADSHGNKVSSPVVAGSAVFSGLTPDTAYTVSVEVAGFHQLTGVTSKVYSTPIQTRIAQMSAITGSESGSVILSFAVEGPDSDQWNVIYNADGEAERVTTFPSHMVTLAGLTVGKEYTFRIEPVDDIYISGETEIKYTARNLVCAENLHITSCINGVLTAQWETPAGESVTEWSVRCYNESGYDQSVITSDNTVSFDNIDDTAAYIVEVTAAEMSVNQRVQISENSITVSDFVVDSAKSDVLSLSWKANRDIPAEGWTIRYSVNGVNAATAINAKENTVEIPVVPNGNYLFTILDGSGNAVLGGPFVHTQTAAVSFENYSVTKNDITVRLCKTPAASSWSYKDLKDEDYVNTFSIGQNISMVMALSKAPKLSDDKILITFAIYDENDNLVGFSHDSQTWQSMWYQNYCELDITGIPANTGTYNLIVYFNGAEAGSQKFAITA